MGLADKLVRTFGLRGLLLLALLTPAVLYLQGQVLRSSAQNLAASEAIRWLDPAREAFRTQGTAARGFLERARRGGLIGGWLVGESGSGVRFALPEYQDAIRALAEPDGEQSTQWSAELQGPLFLLRFPVSGDPREELVLVREFGRQSLEIDRAQGLTAVLLIYSLFVLYAGLHFLAERAAGELEARRVEVEGYARELEAIQDHLIRTSRLTHLGELTASVAHEVKNPLASLSLGLQVLATKVPEEDARREDVQRLLEAAHRLDRVVASMLRFSRPSGGAEGPVDLVGVAEKVNMLMRKELKDRGISLVLDVPPGSVRVQGEAVQVEQVVLNLLLNARDASPRGSEVTLSVDRDGSRGRVRVRDRGQGLGGRDPEVFFRAFHTTKGAEGTGLGLAISRRIARSFGGEVQLEEVPEEAGVRATLVLPDLEEETPCPVPAS